MLNLANATYVRRLHVGDAVVEQRIYAHRVRKHVMVCPVDATIMHNHHYHNHLSIYLLASYLSFTLLVPACLLIKTNEATC